MSACSAELVGPHEAAPPTVFLVEDHREMREIMSEFLSLAEGLVVVGEAGTGEEALTRLENGGRPDLLLIDVSLPGMSGLELLEAVRERWPEVRCLMVSGHGQEEHVRRALRAGSRGYVLKGDPYELPEAVRRVMDGGVFLSAKLRRF